MRKAVGLPISKAAETSMENNKLGLRLWHKAIVLTDLFTLQIS